MTDRTRTIEAEWNGITILGKATLMESEPGFAGGIEATMKSTSAPLSWSKDDEVCDVSYGHEPFWRGINEHAWAERHGLKLLDDGKITIEHEDKWTLAREVWQEAHRAELERELRRQAKIDFEDELEDYSEGCC